jgi:hypothetical protein
MLPSTNFSIKFLHRHLPGNFNSTKWSIAKPGLVHEFKAESCKEHPDFSGLEARHFYDIK